jgi:3-dehydroquinate dehydratase / shikimate dehydrogenase
MLHRQSVALASRQLIALSFDDAYRRNDIQDTTMTNKVAVSLAPRDTDACLQILATVAPLISMAEIRLDLMESFDLPRLQSLTPCPLIITCRAQREGGRFSGSEEERLAILRQAIELECAYIDVEWDCIDRFAERPRGKTQIIASRHWFDHMPASLEQAYADLAPRADVVKLVGLARQPRDLLPVLTLLRDATSPVIVLAMGAVGQVIRLVAPCFPQSLLTYGAASGADITAPGQLSVAEMVQRYHLDLVGPHTQVYLHLCASAAVAESVVARNAPVTSGAELYLPVLVASDQATELAESLPKLLPQLAISIDPALQPGVAAT